MHRITGNISIKIWPVIDFQAAKPLSSSDESIGDGGGGELSVKMREL